MTEGPCRCRPLLPLPAVFDLSTHPPGIHHHSFLLHSFTPLSCLPFRDLLGVPPLALASLFPSAIIPSSHRPFTLALRRVAGIFTTKLGELELVANAASCYQSVFTLHPRHILLVCHTSISLLNSDKVMIGCLM